MSAPLKPWEHARMAQNSRILNSSAPVTQIISTPVGRIRSSAPPLPPRPVTSRYGSSYHAGNNSNFYGAYGRQMYSPYSSYGGYGGYGDYGGTYGGYGNMYGAGAESRFIQLAEDSTRPAFDGIESVVRAFSSLAMMLDSTFFAVTGSFRAVLGVAENFGRIRTMFGQIWSSFAILRALNWIYRKVLSFLGIRRYNDLGQEAWKEAIGNSTTEGAQKVSSWPIFMFFGMIISAPYFISKLLPPLQDKKDPKNWPSKGRQAVASYTFHASNAEELSLTPGEKIIIAPRSVQENLNLSNTNWVYAKSERGTGLVPLNYLQPVSTSVATENTSVPLIVPPEIGIPENVGASEPVIVEQPVLAQKTDSETLTSQSSVKGEQK